MKIGKIVTLIAGVGLFISAIATKGDGILTELLIASGLLALAHLFKTGGTNGDSWVMVIAFAILAGLAIYGQKFIPNGMVLREASNYDVLKVIDKSYENARVATIIIICGIGAAFFYYCGFVKETFGSTKLSVIITYVCLGIIAWGLLKTGLGIFNRSDFVDLYNCISIALIGASIGIVYHEFFVAHD